MSIYRKLIIIGIIGLVMMAIIFGIIMIWTTYMVEPLKVELPPAGSPEAYILLHLIHEIEDDELRDFLRLIWFLSRWDFI